MTTKNTGIWLNRGIYDSPYDAFTNYMNILGDFISRVNSLYPVDMDNEELNSLLTTIKNQGEELVALNKEVERLQAKLEKAEAKSSCRKERTCCQETGGGQENDGKEAGCQESCFEERRITEI